jgi:hypothetical protein
MEESGQLHALSALPLAYKTKLRTEQDTGWAPELFEHSEERKILLAPSMNQVVIHWSSSLQVSHCTITLFWFIILLFV